MARKKNSIHTNSRMSASRAGGDLATAAQTGDRAAITRLLVLLQPLVLAIARRRLGNEADALDVVQEVLLRIFVGLPAFDPTQGDVSSWAARICRNEVVTFLRRRWRRPTVPLEGEVFPGTDADPAVSAAATELRTLVREAVDELPRNERVAIKLRFLDGMSYQEAAGRAAVPLGTLTGWTYRGVSSLRRRLGRAG